MVEAIHEPHKKGTASRPFLTRLESIEEYRQKLQYAAQYHKDMEHRVHPGRFGANAIQHGADGVGNAAQQE